VGGAHLPLQAH